MINVWNKLSGASAAAAERGDMVRARELGGAAREAWLRHYEAVEAEIKAQKQDSRAQRLDTGLGTGALEGQRASSIEE